MFERFTDAARRAVVLAQDEARRLGHDYIGTEHLLLALVSEGGGTAAGVLSSFDVSHDAVLARMRELLGPSLSDADALLSIGIDLDTVRQAVEESFGPGALERQVPRRRLGWRRRRRACTQRTYGHIPFTPRAKKALERSLREAVALRHGHIGTEHLLLGVIADPDGVAAKVLVRLGADPYVVRSRTLAAIGRVA